ncbi:MAG: serine hydrolase domain-containing protein, partial [Gammaproteobacteria bacterium]
MSGARTLNAADAEARLDGFMPYAIARGDVAGAVVTIVKDGQVLVAKGYGYADVEKKTPVDPATTMFRPGSVSKLVTWTAVMQQVEAGKLDLDTDVNTYLDFTLPERDDGPVTLRHILTHTVGFEEQVKGLITEDPAPAMSLGEYARNYPPTRIFRAGTTPAYSNYATALAGYLVERASGQSFDDYV